MAVTPDSQHAGGLHVHRPIHHTLPSSRLTAHLTHELARVSGLSTLKPTTGVEPVAYRLQGGCSAIELRRHDNRSAPILLGATPILPKPISADNAHRVYQETTSASMCTTSTPPFGARRVRSYVSMLSPNSIQCDCPGDGGIQTLHPAAHGDANEIITRLSH